MATYGRYEVIKYPSGCAVTDMNTHEWAHEKLMPEQAAHALARKLEREEAEKKLKEAKP